MGDAVAVFSQITYMLVFVLYLLSIVDSIRRRHIADLLSLHIVFALACGVTILTVGSALYHLPYLPFFCLCASIVLDCQDGKRSARAIEIVTYQFIFSNNPYIFDIIM